MLSGIPDPCSTSSFWPEKSTLFLDHPMCLSSRAWNSLILVDVKSVARKEPIPLLYLIVLTMDVNLLGLGWVLGTATAQRTWTLTEAQIPINILELRAIYPILLWSDNATAVAYINHQGGTRCCAVQKKTAYYPTSFSRMRDILGAKNTCRSNCYIKFIAYTQ